MRKHLWTKMDDGQFEEYQPGCIWGVFHALDYHYWHSNVKKILPHRKHDGQRHGKRNGSPKTYLDVHDSTELETLLGADASHVLGNQVSAKTSTRKRSLKLRIKTLVAAEMSEGEDDKKPGAHFLSRRQLRRTFSIHHLEPSKYGLDEISTEQKSPTTDTLGTNNVLDYEHSALSENHNLFPEKCDKTMKTSINKKLDGNASDYQFEDDDVLELFKVNKELFLKILKNTDDGFANCLDTLLSDRKGRLTKSGSFPSADLSRNRKFRPSELKHKSNENWSFPKGEKMLPGTRVPKLAVSKSLKDLYTKSGPLIQMDNGGNEVNHETCFSSSDSAEELDKRTNLLKEIKGSITHIRRTSSLNESVGRYARLLNHSLGSEPKLQVSKSLRLPNEHEIRTVGPSSKSSRRIRSLSNLDSYSLLNEETWGSNFPGGHEEPTPEGIPVSTELYGSLDTIEENIMVERRDGSPRVEKLASVKVCGDYERISETDGHGEEMEEIKVGESNSRQEQSPVPVPESCLEDEKSRAAFTVPEDSACLCNYSDEKESSSVDIHIRSETDPPQLSCDKENSGNLKNRNTSSIKAHMNTGDPDFYFVKDILALSGFLRKGNFGTWHTQDQPLNPSVFEEVESHCLEEQNIQEFYHHQLLFDMINEVLVQIYDISFTYYPRALSSTCRVRPMPLGHRVLDEVWTSINRSLNSTPDPEQSLDDIVAKDLAKDDCWMNLQLETECLALELDDLIFEELLEELLEEAIGS